MKVAAQENERTPTRNRFGAELRGTLVPSREGRHGPLPPLLVGLTFVTGLVDAFSYLALGHVFVANMTGNVVFLGFAVAGASGFSIPASLVALASFVAGALAGGKLGTRLGHHRGTLLSIATSIEAALLAVALAIAAVSGDPVGSTARYSLIISLGAALGMQNATVRRLAVPDLTTTVLTLTITGIAADSRLAGGGGSLSGRRLVAVTAMFAGALVGAVLVLDVHIVAPLALALAIVTALSVWSRLASRAAPLWTHPV